MAEGRRVGSVVWGAATDEDNAARKARRHVLRPVGGMNLDDVAVLKGKVRHRAECATAHDEHLAARQVEETLDIGDNIRGRDCPLKVDGRGGRIGR
jgi:hypothetical protein